MEEADKIKKVDDSDKNRDQCVCPYCPSYPHDCEGEKLYCATGKSRCDIEPKACICNTCPVYFEYILNGLFFCDKEIHNEIYMRKRKSDEDESFYRSILDIKKKAATGKSIISSMGSLKKFPFSFNDLHFVPAQINIIPLNAEEKINTQTIIGPASKKPFIVSSPLLIAAMSFGAVSKNVRLVIANTAKELNIGFNSGEGGVLSEEKEIAPDKMIVQYSTGRFGITEELLKSAPAIEIRFGQGAYPGKGSFLPADKITRQIAEIRGIQRGESAYSPASHFDMKTPEQIKDKVKKLKNISGGVPVGAKIGCGDIEKDLEILVDSKVDFISLDGFGGATGATDLYVKENVGIPIIAALPRAYNYLNELEVKDEVSLLAGGRLLDSADFAKCLALGADAVYMGTAALIAIGCDQYRICYTGNCPTGVATQNPHLVNQLKIDDGVKKLSNFISISNNEIANLTRIVGKNDVNMLNREDLVSMNRDLSLITGVKWINGI